MHAPPRPPRLRVAAPLALLVAIGILNYLDRILPAILAEPIKADLRLTDTALGIVNGLGFLLIYAAASIPMAQLSDKGRYGLVLTAALGGWSAMTMLGGFATNGWQLAFSRMGVAVGEAGCMPAAHAFITRHVAADRRAAAIAFFNLSLPLGTMAGFVLGGYVGEWLGWRATFLVMGAAGLLLAALALLILPLRAAAQAAPADARHLALFGFVPLLRKPSLRLILAGSAFIGMGGYTASAFTPAFLMRSHGLSLGEAGLCFGLAGGGSAVVGLLAVGWLSDRLARRDPRWLLGTVILTIAAALPFAILALHTRDLGFATAALAIAYVVPIAYAAPVAVALHRLAPLALRARMSALLLLSTGIAGGFGPVVAGAISDALAPALGPQALGRALHVIPVCYALGAGCYLLALRTFREDVTDAW